MGCSPWAAANVDLRLFRKSSLRSNRCELLTTIHSLSGSVLILLLYQETSAYFLAFISNRITF